MQKQTRNTDKINFEKIVISQCLHDADKNNRKSIKHEDEHLSIYRLDDFKHERNT